MQPDEPIAQVPFGQYLTDWLVTQRTRLQPSTWESYRGMVRRYVIPVLGEIPVGELTVAGFERFYAELLTDGGHRGKTLSLRTVAYVKAVLAKALADAVRAERFDRNPAARACVPRVDPNADEEGGELAVWDEAQLAAFLRFTADHPWHALWRLAVTTGMRRGELVGLRAKDLDLDGGRIHVRRGIVVVDGKPRLKRPKTARLRTLQIDADTVEALRAQLARRDDLAILAEDDWSNDWDLLFTDPLGAPLDPDRVTREFIGLVAAAGLPRIRLHDLRHSHASGLLRMGVPVHVVSERLGHANVSMTLDVYAHLLPGMDAEAAQRFGDYLGGPAAPA